MQKMPGLMGDVGVMRPWAKLVFGVLEILTTLAAFVVFACGMYRVYELPRFAPSSDTLTREELFREKLNFDAENFKELADEVVESVRRVLVVYLSVLEPIAEMAAPARAYGPIPAVIGCIVLYSAAEFAVYKHPYLGFWDVLAKTTAAASFVCLYVAIIMMMFSIAQQATAP